MDAETPQPLGHSLLLKFDVNTLACRCAMAWSLACQAHPGRAFLSGTPIVVDAVTSQQLLHVKFYGTIWAHSPMARVCSGIPVRHPNPCVCCNFNTVGPILTISSSMESSRSVRQGHLPVGHVWAFPSGTTILANAVTPQPLGQFFQFQVLNHLGL